MRNISESFPLLHDLILVAPQVLQPPFQRPSRHQQPLPQGRFCTIFYALVLDARLKAYAA